jgi:uncharacterized protein involved in response to NO
VTRWQRAKLRYYRARNRARSAIAAVWRLATRPWWLSAVGLGFVSWGVWIAHQGPIAVGVSFMAMEWRIGDKS